MIKLIGYRDSIEIDRNLLMEKSEYFNGLLSDFPDENEIELMEDFDNITILLQLIFWVKSEYITTDLILIDYYQYYLFDGDITELFYTRRIEYIDHKGMYENKLLSVKNLFDCEENIKNKILFLENLKIKLNKIDLYVYNKELFKMSVDMNNAIYAIKVAHEEYIKVEEELKKYCVNIKYLNNSDRFSAQVHYKSFNCLYHSFKDKLKSMLDKNAKI